MPAEDNAPSTLTTYRCRCGDFPALKVINDNAVQLVCSCHKTIGPMAFDRVGRLVYEWNHLYRRGL